jgi:hypothetical protein
MNLIESKEEPERAFSLRLLGNCGVAQPQISHPSNRVLPVRPDSAF